MVAGKLFCTAVLIMLFYGLSAQKNPQSSIDSAISVAAKQRAAPGPFTKTCFFIADEYMNIEQYDSAQLWLNKIHAILPLKSVSLENYFLLTRQAEVYYYNNLQQLGLQESRRGLAMAQALNDSILLADSYNFLGLFYMNIDSAAASVQFYQQGLAYTKQPPNLPHYISLSKPHHLHGNLAEAYYKLQKLDSALLHYRYSLQSAGVISWPRGIAVACSGLGDVFFALGQADSALYYYDRGAVVSAQSNDVDVALICYGGKASCYNVTGSTPMAFAELDKGFALLKKLPNINRFYSLGFLTAAVNIYKQRQNTAALVHALEVKSDIETANIAGNNSQIQTILNAGMENEKRLLSLQVTEAERKQELANSRLLIALGGIAMLVIAFLVYRYYQNQKIAVSKIRHKISQDLHDDIGASLSSLQIYGTIAEQSIAVNPGKTVEMVQKMNAQSREILENMSDIVWSMKSNSTGGTSLETKIKNYASELLQEKQIHFTCIIQPDAEMALQSMKARKNVLLIIREILNNTVKYSRASQSVLHIYIQDKNWIMDIGDNGSGFQQGREYEGNGLKNIRSRTAELNGTCTVNGEGGTRYMFVFPLTVITDTGW
ncbi:MAG: histidine kinase [Ferruginibacter sp.]